jgi:hypothetical protein
MAVNDFDLYQAQSCAQARFMTKTVLSSRRIFFTNLPQSLVSFKGVCQNRSANGFGWLIPAHLELERKLVDYYFGAEFHNVTPSNANK